MSLRIQREKLSEISEILSKYSSAAGSELYYMLMKEKKKLEKQLSKTDKSKVELKNYTKRQDMPPENDKNSKFVHSSSQAKDKDNTTTLAQRRTEFQSEKWKREKFKNSKREHQFSKIRQV